MRPAGRVESSTPRPRLRTGPARAALAVVAAGVLAACSSQAAGGGGSGTAQGVTADTITIGTTLPLSGGAAAAGQGFQAGLRTAVQEVNAAGGINGRKLELTVLDDGFVAARSVANIRRLGDQEQVFSVLSPAGTANLPGSYPYLERTGLPMFAPVLPPDPKLDEVYLIGTSQRDQARVMVDFLADQGARTVAVIGQDNDLGQAMREGTTEQAQRRGLRVVASETTEPNSTEVSSAVLNAREAKPDAIILGTDNTQSSLIMQEVADLGWQPMIIGSSSTVTTGSPNTVGPAGPTARGVYGTLIFELPSSDPPEVAEWRQAAQQSAPNSLDNGFALQAYGSSQVFFEILRRMGDDLTWQNFHRTAESLQGYESGIFPPISFGDAASGGHVGTRGAKVAQWTGTEWKLATPDWISPGS
ncbi:MAG: ABC transporter substrate-binding protein [Pseudonocardiaceae bacterium]|nr:ABC transporter substrate-binding protein [Pseudonocardiaceae bacterium]